MHVLTLNHGIISNENLKSVVQLILAMNIFFIWSSS